MFGLEMRELLMIGGGGLLGLAVIVFVLKSLLGGGKRKKRVQKQANLREFLGEFPEAPPLKSKMRLWIDGVEARLRLVIIAPTGAQHDAIDIEQVPDILNALLRGLGGCVASDKPRVRIWPPQLSVAGFTPTYFREVESPDPGGEESNWIRLAGLIKARGKPYLLGLALFTEDATDIGSIGLEPNEWNHHLKMER